MFSSFQVVEEWKAKVDDLGQEVEASQREARNYNSEVFRLKAAWDEAVEQCNPTHPTSLISFNGTSDFERPYNGMDYMSSVNEIINYWAEFNDTDSIPTISSFQSSGLETEHYIYESGLNNVSIEHYKFINGGHDWFEMDNSGLNIDQIIWNFVSKYDLDGLIE